MQNPLQTLAASRFNEDSNHYLIRWWVNKFNLPHNHPLLLSLTWEELYFEYLTYFYNDHPDELKKVHNENDRDKTYMWSGNTSEEYEKGIKSRFKNIPNVDLSKWVTKESEVSEDEFDDDFSKT